MCAAIVFPIDVCLCTCSLTCSTAPLTSVLMHWTYMCFFNKARYWVKYNLCAGEFVCSYLHSGQCSSLKIRTSHINHSFFNCNLGWVLTNIIFGPQFAANSIIHCIRQVESISLSIVQQLLTTSTDLQRGKDRIVCTNSDLTILKSLCHCKK